MDYSMKQKTNIIAAVCLIASAIYAGNQTFDQYRAWPEGNQIGPVYEQDFSTGDLKVFTAFPGYTIGKYGYNGSPGLRAERKPGEKYGFVSVTIPNLKPGKTYKVSMLCRGENIQGEPHGFCIEFYKKPGGQYIGGLYDAQPITNEWKKIERPFVLQEGQEARVSLYIRDNASGVLYYDNLQVEEVGNLWSVLPTRLTNLSLWTDDSSFELHAAIPEGAKNFAVLATLDLDGKRYEKLLKPDAKGFCSGDFGPLPAGHGKIDFTLLDMAAKRRLASSAYEINVRTRDAVSANAVTIDRDHRLIVDGKPFMPIGIYGAWQGSMKDEDLQRIADAGFNTLHLYGMAWHRGPGKYASDMEGIRAGVDQVHKYGLKLVASLKEQLHGWNHKVDDAFGPIPVVKKIVSNLKDHPALLVWYISDEEARSRVPDIIRLRNTINAIDPDHPTWTLTCFYDDLNYYATSGDILGIDPYPVKATHGPQSLRELEDALAAGEKTGTTIWHVPQAFNWAVVDKNMSDEAFRKSRFQTREEVRTAPLLGAIHGAKGFVFYAYYDITTMEKRAPERGEQDWDNLKETVQVLHDLEPWIMSTEKAPAVTVESTPEKEVYARAFVKDGDVRVVIASMGKPCKAIITVPGNAELKSRFGKTRALGNGRYEFTSDAIDSDVLE